jgi:hypothetical protein
MEVAHSVTVRPIEAIEHDIYQVLDRMVFETGRLLHEARTNHPKLYKQWVEERMPFGLDAARRIHAVYLAYSNLDDTVLGRLPKAWQALFALRNHVDSGKLLQAVESGEIGPETTQREAIRKSREWSTNSSATKRVVVEPRYHEIDILAGKLIAFDVSELNPNVKRALLRWLNLPETGHPTVSE